jgi:hypothetical protein
MISRALTSAVLPAIALPALAFGHTPSIPGLGISRAVHLVTSAVGSVTAPALAPASTPRHITSPTDTAKRRQPASYVAIDCQGSPVVRPQTFLLACADGGDRLNKLHWASWSPGYATATGIQAVNDCVPSCADGKVHDYPIRVILWGGASVAGHSGERRYQMITLLYTAREPQVGGGKAQMAGPLSETGDLWG